jgi:hypothetical protein
MKVCVVSLVWQDRFLGMEPKKARRTGQTEQPESKIGSERNDLKPEQGINFQFQVASMSRTGAIYAAAFDEVDHCDPFAGEMACLNQAPFS